VYGGDDAGTRYSSLADINRGTVTALRVAWTYRSGETEPRFATEEETSLEVTPLVLDGTMYLSTPLGRVIALDPATGGERWVFDPQVDRSVAFGDFTNRGVAAWLDPAAAPEAPCRRRIFVATIDGRLIALDGKTGRPCAEFGDRGTVRLKAQLRVPPFEEAAYEVTSPPVVVNSLVISGSAIADNSRLAPASGEVQAFDARNGTPRWRCFLEQRKRAHDRERQRLVGHGGRCRARPDLRANLEPSARLLRWEAAWRQPLRQLDRGTAGLDG
jgi:quinoprotein glucose dehydrogenase